MFRLSKSLFASIVAMLVSPASADVVHPMATFGTWDLNRAEDANGALTCAASLHDYTFVVMTSGVVTITTGQPMRQIRLQFGDDQPLPFRAPSREERSRKLVKFQGADFEKLLGAHRIRIYAELIGKAPLSIDLTLQGTREAAAHVAAGCKDM